MLKKARIGRTARQRWGTERRTSDLLGGSLRVHTHLVPLLVLVLELHVPVHHREQCVVRRAAHVRAGMEPGAALPDEDAPGPHQLAPEALHAEVLRVRVAPVTRRADALLVSHSVFSRPLRPESSLP